MQTLLPDVMPGPAQVPAKAPAQPPAPAPAQDPAPAPAQPPAQPPFDDSSSDGNEIIAGVMVSGVLIVCLIAAAAAVVIVWRMRRNHANGGTPSAATDRPPGGDKPAVLEKNGGSTHGVSALYPAHAPHEWPVLPQPQHTLTGQEVEPQRMPCADPATPQTPPLQHIIAAVDDVLRDHTVVPLHPAATGLTSTAVSAHARSRVPSSAENGSAHASRSGTAHSAAASVVLCKRRLQHELVGMCDGEELFMDAYRVLSPREQREGGQGVVQFMRWARTEEPVAVKFFLSQVAFDEEMQLYAEASLRSMMPVMREAMRAGQVRNRSGYVFPAFVVLERGESLQDWRRNVMPQTATVVDVRALPACIYPAGSATGCLYLRRVGHQDLPGNPRASSPQVSSSTAQGLAECTRSSADLRFVASAIAVIVSTSAASASAQRFISPSERPYHANNSTGTTRTHMLAGSDTHCQEARAATRQRLGASGYQAGQHPAPPQGAWLDPHGLWMRSSNRCEAIGSVSCAAFGLAKHRRSSSCLHGFVVTGAGVCAERCLQLSGSSCTACSAHTESLLLVFSQLVCTESWESRYGFQTINPKQLNPRLCQCCKELPQAHGGRRPP